MAVGLAVVAAGVGEGVEAVVPAAVAETAGDGLSDGDGETAGAAQPDTTRTTASSLAAQEGNDTRPIGGS